MHRQLRGTVIRVVLLLTLLPSSLQAAELLQNGDFAKGLAGWEARSHKEFQAIKPRIGRATGGNVVSVSISKPAAPGYLVLSQEVDVKSQKTYRFSAEMRLQGDGPVVMVVRQIRDPADIYGCRMQMKPAANWQRFELTFQATSIDPSNPPYARIGVGGIKGRIDIRNCSLMEVSGVQVRNKVRGDLKQIELEAAKPQSAARKPAKSADAAELVAAFTASNMKARKEYEKQTVELSGRLTRVTAGPRGTSIIELEGGRVKILAGDGVVSEEDSGFIKEELAAAKRRIDGFGDYARQERISTRERKARELDAYPRVVITGTFVGYRSSAVTFRNGRDFSVSGGEELPTVKPKRKKR
jgi:hypothetical protein